MECSAIAESFRISECCCVLLVEGGVGERVAVVAVAVVCEAGSDRSNGVALTPSTGAIASALACCCCCTSFGADPSALARKACRSFLPASRASFVKLALAALTGNGGSRGCVAEEGELVAELLAVEEAELE